MIAALLDSSPSSSSSSDDWEHTVLSLVRIAAHVAASGQNQIPSSSSQQHVLAMPSSSSQVLALRLGSIFLVEICFYVSVEHVFISFI